MMGLSMLCNEMLAWDENIVWHNYLSNNSVAIGDADNDGDAEVVVGTNGYVLAYKFDGTAWSENIVWHNSLSNSSVAIGDADNDDDAEVVVGTNGYVLMYKSNAAPVAICQNIQVALDGNGQATIIADDVDGGSYDSDGDPIALSIDINSFDCIDVGIPVAVTLTVDDGELTDSCTATVTVVDNLAPVVGCALIQVDGPGRSVNSMPAAAANFRRVQIGIATDNCGAASVVGSIDDIAVVDGNVVKISIDPTQPTGKVSQGPKGYIHIIGATGVLKVTATDVNGNIGTCEATP